jgi:hypothetical protein
MTQNHFLSKLGESGGAFGKDKLRKNIGAEPARRQSWSDDATQSQNHHKST